MRTDAHYEAATAHPKQASGPAQAVAAEVKARGGGRQQDVAGLPVAQSYAVRKPL